jgi:hypothetical protein
MRLKQLIAIVLVSSLITLAFLIMRTVPDAVIAQTTKDFYVGIDAAYADIEKIREVTDEVSAYTNLAIIGSTAITRNATKLNETCQYLNDKGLSFIVYQEVPLGWSRNNFTPSNWAESAKNRWGERFLGFYYMDELGGKQLDMSSWSSIKNAQDYEDMSVQYSSRIKYYTDWFRSGYSDGADVSLFTSDYALYWFDYKSGYDTLLAEFGWNYSRQLNVALCRGAATVQNKDWGTMITWTYTEPPYIESGEELYNDLVLAYENGAKYAVVFDSNEEYTQGILAEEHFNALRQFWTFVQNNPRENNVVGTRTAVVLPNGYAYGFRGPEDKIWGVWEADNISYPLSVGINNLFEQYGKEVDIIYDDNLEPNNTYGYENFIYWNDTSKFPVVTSTTSPIAPSSPTPTPTLFKEPEKTNSLKPTSAASPANNLTSPILTPSQLPLPTQEALSEQNEFDSVNVVLICGTIASVVAAVIFLIRKR